MSATAGCYFCTCLDSVVASVVPLLVLIGWYLLPWVDSLQPPCPAQVTLGLNPPPSPWYPGLFTSGRISGVKTLPNHQVHPLLVTTDERTTWFKQRQECRGQNIGEKKTWKKKKIKDERHLLDQSGFFGPSFCGPGCSVISRKSGNTVRIMTHVLRRRRSDYFCSEQGVQSFGGICWH